MTDQCGAPWCERITQKASGKEMRQIAGIELCKACYSHYWIQEKRQKIPKEILIIRGIDPPKYTIHRQETVCAQQGCEKKLPSVNDAQIRRQLGHRHVCTKCYKRSWRYSKKFQVSLEEGFAQTAFYTKGRRANVSK